MESPLVQLPAAEELCQAVTRLLQSQPHLGQPSQQRLHDILQTVSYLCSSPCGSSPRMHYKGHGRCTPCSTADLASPLQSIGYLQQAVHPGAPADKELATLILARCFSRNLRPYLTSIPPKVAPFHASSVLSVLSVLLCRRVVETAAGHQLGPSTMLLKKQGLQMLERRRRQLKVYQSMCITQTACQQGRHAKRTLGRHVILNSCRQNVQVNCA